jgi:hypothetical protein
VTISEGQWNVLAVRRVRDKGAIVAGETGVSAPAGAVLYGLDTAGNRHLLVPVADGKVVEDRDSEAVQVGTRTLVQQGRSVVYADLACLKARLVSEFGHVVDDVLEEISAGASATSVCRNALEKWRDLLRAGRSGPLSDSSAAGLFGELSLLRKLSKYSPRAAELWVGPEGGRFDFMGADSAIEVKASVRRYGRLLEINGETQLEAPPGVALHLYYVRLEPVPAGGERLHDVFRDVISSGVSPVLLAGKLARLGVDEAVLGHDSRAFRILETRLYRVEGGFPRITRSSFVGGVVPSGTLRLNYLIDLSGEPPFPLDDRSSEDAMTGLLAAKASGNGP